MTGPASQVSVLVLRSSPTVLVFLLAIHLLALLSLVLSNLGLALQLVLTLVLALHFHYGYGRFYRLRHRQSVIALRRQGASWWLQFPDRQWVAAAPIGDIVATPFLILIRFRCGSWGSRIPVVILADSADRDPIRRLRVQLRYG